MTKDEIIKLAREAGLCNELGGIEGDSGSFYSYRAELEAFGRACYEAGRVAERKECERLCARSWEIGGTLVAKEFAEAIRARGKP